MHGFLVFGQASCLLIDIFENLHKVCAFRRLSCMREWREGFYEKLDMVWAVLGLID